METPKIQIDAAVLAPAAKAAATVALRRTVNPILGQTWLSVTPQALEVRATDHEVYFAEKLAEANASGEATVTVDAQRLAQLAERLKGPVELRFEKQALVVKNGELKARFQSMDPDAFPAYLAKPATASLDGPALARAMAVCVPYASEDPGRESISGVIVRAEAGGVDFVATNGHRLVRYRLGSEVDPNLKLFLSKALAKALQGLAVDAPTVGVGADERRAYFSFGNVSIYGPLIAAEPANYQQVLPSEKPNYQAKIDPKALRATIERVAVAADKGDNTGKCAILIPEEEAILVQCKGEVGEAEDYYRAASFEGKTDKTSAQVRYLADALSALEGEEEVVLGIDDAVSPITLRGGPQLHVVMPTRV